MSNNSNRTSLTKLRCTNSKVSVHNQVYLYDTHMCTLCDINLVGVEYYYILIFPYFTDPKENHINICIL